MNFEFSDELNLLRDQARRFLADRSSTKAVRAVMDANTALTDDAASQGDGQGAYDRELWQGIASMGWLGAAIPEAYGGVELGHEGLCVLAEEIGRALAPVPFTSSVCLATEAILEFGSEEQRKSYLPRLASGELIGCFALAEGPGNPRAQGVAAQVRDGVLNGDKWPVADGGIADFAIVAALDANAAPALYIADLHATGVTRTSLKTIDPSRQHSRVRFERAAAAPLGTPAATATAPASAQSQSQNWSRIEALLDRAAVLIAFEQIGGAQRCLQMATGYAKERHAFGRPIGSFQAIKHKLADVYIATELARSNAYYGAWALATRAAELPLAAASARVSATQAYHLASKENIQTHGGMGITWELDCHLYYRRSKMLALTIGSNPWWQDQLIGRWEKQLAA